MVTFTTGPHEQNQWFQSTVGTDCSKAQLCCRWALIASYKMAGKKGWNPSSICPCSQFFSSTIFFAPYHDGKQDWNSHKSFPCPITPPFLFTSSFLQLAFRLQFRRQNGYAPCDMYLCTTQWGHKTYKWKIKIGLQNLLCLVL